MPWNKLVPVSLTLFGDTNYTIATAKK